MSDSVLKSTIPIITQNQVTVKHFTYPRPCFDLWGIEIIAYKEAI